MKAARWNWQQSAWPTFNLDEGALSLDLAEAHRMHGVIEGKAAAIGLTSTSDIALDATTAEAVSTAAIEGERLSMDVVRSSVMRRLGMSATGSTDRSVEGLLDVLSDATSARDQSLDDDRLCRWQAALFPGGVSGITRIVVGRYRDHEEPMQIVSGPPGRESVHFEAPPSRDVPMHMSAFLKWFAETTPGRGAVRIDGLTRAAIAHLWFESIHPFEDGNGRVGRAIVDMVIAQHLKQPVRLFSLSRQLQNERGAYYAALNSASRGLDVTPWVQWFVRQCTAAFAAASNVMDQSLVKRKFLELHEAANLNERQRKVLQRLLDAGDGQFLGGLNVEKYSKLTGAPKSTATRDLAAMVQGGQLWTEGQGKALRYYVNVPGWTHGIERSASTSAANPSLGGGLLAQSRTTTPSASPPSHALKSRLKRQ